MKITLCLLTKNELLGCCKDLPLIRRECFDEIYAVDGGSTDGTIEFLESQGVPVYIQPIKGYNAAYHFAFQLCKTDAIVFFHPKGSVPPADCEKFCSYFDDGYDLIIASRNIDGAHNEEDGKVIKYRKWFVNSLGFISSFLFRREGNMIWDVLHGFRGMTTSGFHQIVALPEGVTIDLEMVCRAYKKKLKVIEFSTTEMERLEGVTHFKALPTGWEMVKYLFFELFRKE